MMNSTKLNDIQIKTKSFSTEQIIPLMILIGLYVVFSIISSAFLELESIYLLLQQNAAVGIVSLGIMAIIITGALDFTVGETVALAGVAATKIYMSTSQNLVVLIFCALVIGALIGLVNGSIITKMKIQPFIATLAMMSIIKGLTMIIGEASAPKLTKADIIYIGSGDILGIPMPFVILVIMILVTSFILNKTRLGTYWYAIGGNASVAKQAGINIDRCRILVHMFGGIYASVAAIITIARIRTVVPNISGTLLLDAAAAAIIGGTSVSGGKGTVFGTIVGVFIISLTQLSHHYCGDEP
ncbi:MAG: ABC transporter permease [Clostridia bacterium]|nr:ABC transporter permease [Clostridia bacterium]